MESKMWICVYRDTIEEHDDDWNLTDILVTEEFVKQYFNELKSEYWDSLEEFLTEFTADDTEDFYSYAVKHNAIIQMVNW